MEHDLVGYLLNALDPDERAQVEAHLRANPDAQLRLDELRQAMEPLAWDAAVSAPAGLADRTLGQVAAAGAAAGAVPTYPTVRWPSRRLVEVGVAAACVMTVT